MLHPNVEETKASVTSTGLISNHFITPDQSEILCASDQSDVGEILCASDQSETGEIVPASPEKRQRIDDLWVSESAHERKVREQMAKSRRLKPGDFSAETHDRMKQRPRDVHIEKAKSEPWLDVPTTRRLNPEADALWQFPLDK